MKKILFSVAVIATVAIAGWNYQQNKEVELSDLAMENVEAPIGAVDFMIFGLENHKNPSHYDLHMKNFNPSA